MPNARATSGGDDDDVAEMRRRREQLLHDVSTSYARIAEIRARAGGAGAGENRRERRATGRTSAGRSWGIVMDAAQKLNAARAELSALPAHLWRRLRGMTNPPPAAAAVVGVAVCLLSGQPATSWDECRAIRDLPRSLAGLEPSALAETEKVRLWRRGFSSEWPYDRVVCVHPTLGPLHRWITAMLEVSGADKGASSPVEGHECVEGDRGLGGAESAEMDDLLQELRAHEDYLQMAMEELAEMDALLGDSTHEAANVVASSARVSPFSSFPSVGSCMSVAVQPNDVLPLPREELFLSSWAPMSATEEEADFYAKRQTQAHAERGDTSPFFSSLVRGLSIVPMLRSNEECVSKHRESHTMKQNETNSNDSGGKGDEKKTKHRGALRPWRAESGTLLLSLSPRNSRLGSSVTAPRAHSACSIKINKYKTFPDTFVPHSNAVLLQERADLIERVRELEGKLGEVYGRNPSMAEFHLMRDEMMAARRELEALRAEHNQLRGQTKRYFAYKLFGPSEHKAECESCDDTHSAAAMTIRELEEKLNAAHVHIKKLENETRKGAVCSSNVSDVMSDDGGLTTKVEDLTSLSSMPVCTHTTTTMTVSAATAAAGGCGASSVGTSAANEKSAPDQQPPPRPSSCRHQRHQRHLQSRLDDALRQIAALRVSVSSTEERLNHEMHARCGAEDEARRLRGELCAVWGRLAGAEGEVRRLLDERSGATTTTAATTTAVGGGEVLLLRQRARESQQAAERLRVEVCALRRRHAEERQRLKDGRAARVLVLARLEKAFAELLHRQECDLKAIPGALARARSELERFGVLQS